MRVLGSLLVIFFIICILSVLTACGHNWPVEPTDNQRQWMEPGIEQRLNKAIQEERVVRDHT